MEQKPCTTCGMYKNLRKNNEKFFISTGDRRISEPSTVFPQQTDLHISQRPKNQTIFRFQETTGWRFNLAPRVGKEIFHSSDFALLFLVGG